MIAASAFTYHRGVAPLMWVLVALASIELLVLHLLLSLWSPLAAALVSVVTLAGIVWLVVAILAMRRRPVRIEDDTVVMQVGRLRRIDVPRAAIRAIRHETTRAALKERGAVNLALIAHPNVLLDLEPPVAGRRGPIRVIAHRLDDPAAFVAALTHQAPTPADAASLPSPGASR